MYWHRADAIKEGSARAFAPTFFFAGADSKKKPRPRVRLTALREGFRFAVAPMIDWTDRHRNNDL
jgi:hypothetical protein